MTSRLGHTVSFYTLFLLQASLDCLVYNTLYLFEKDDTSETALLLSFLLPKTRLLLTILKCVIQNFSRYSILAELGKSLKPDTFLRTKYRYKFIFDNQLCGINSYVWFKTNNSHYCENKICLTTVKWILTNKSWCLFHNFVTGKAITCCMNQT